MGRFATTVALYEELRTPYPPCFFREAAQRLALDRQHALIDLGTGPGLLALGFAPYVGRIVGVDPEPAMLAAAKNAAERASQAFTLIAGKAEDLPEDIGSFDVVTIGRALHWMDREATLARLERLVAPAGRDPRLRVLLRDRWTQPVARRLQHRAARLVEAKPVVGGGQAAGESTGILPAFSAARGFTRPM